MLGSSEPDIGVEVPPRQREQRETPDDVATAFRRGVEFLIGKQDRDGAWRDFRLAPGWSDAWTTAYVAGRLLDATKVATLARADAALVSATHFLLAARRSSGGWGFNPRCATDSDSTALAILFLREFGTNQLIADCAALVRFQTEDGSFATFRGTGSTNGWSRGHPEVTATALRALHGVLAPEHQVMRRGIAYLKAWVERPSPLSCYWWVGEGYLARELAALARQFPTHRLSRSVTASVDDIDRCCFDGAMRLQASHLIGVRRGPMKAAVERLVAWQDPDGGWPSRPILRITDPMSRAIDDDRCRASYVARDEHRIFTTATVVAALAQYSGSSHP